MSLDIFTLQIVDKVCQVDYVHLEADLVCLSKTYRSASRAFASYCVKIPCSECDFIVSRKDTVSKHVKKRHIGATTDQLELTEGDQVMIYRRGKKYTPLLTCKILKVNGQDVLREAFKKKKIAEKETLVHMGGRGVK